MTPTRNPRLEVNRLTAEDRRRIAARVAETIAGWQTSTRGYAPTISADRDTLERVAHHAIGCSEWDLRTCELAEIRRTVAGLAGWSGLAIVGR